ncbi:MAG: hypothetical protein DM484_08830 [Candidatus Methylumidiphilus alinenensis]|uniref:Uncharacterized protein n=1 Tax=Candidatus Methylumidiphilus alinenensis TaxID=2202197 RepID=A0A2W4TEG0_9GAMM|nr:MAG: hypothetical protein DM484_08830 [Candidatus Methylumidiphilus alinenensis]
MTAPNPSLLDRLGHWAKSDSDKRFDADFHLKYLARSSHEHTELVRREVSLLETQGRRNEERFLALEKTGAEIAGLRGDLESYERILTPTQPRLHGWYGLLASLQSGFRRSMPE